ncbi:hypothetical protein [Bradyrhizobium cenepequi]|uniref:hypothetical protein n=1 Tax=Bradyrhizobium cenepequi TaxID=2821403 RepID=UPI001CE28A6C|nr:hypothetical protein [Bradyrhizobium cenepequi]
MDKNEKTGKGAGSLASKAMRSPGSLSNKEIKSLGASALTQRPDRKSPPPSRKK